MVRKKKEKVKKQKKPWTLERYVTLYMFLGFLMLLFSVYKICLERLIDSIVDVGLSLAYYFLFLFEAHDRITPSVTKIPEISIGDFLSFDLQEVSRKLGILFESLLQPSYFFEYLSFLSKLLNWLVVILNFFLPSIAIFVYLRYSRFTSEHIKIKPAKKKKISWYGCLLRRIKLIFRRFFVFVQKMLAYLKTNKKEASALLTVWLINTNLMTILFEVFAYYFYFIVEFDFLSIFSQIVKLIIDLIIALWTLPFPVWCIVGYFVFDKIRVAQALDELRHNEAKNRGFINSNSMVIMLTGSMGTGKTRMAVDISLSLEQEFRDRALDLMCKNMFRFPKFDFLCFQKALVEEIKSGRVKNWAGCRRWVRSCRDRYNEDPRPENLFGYDEQLYPMTYNDGLKILRLWKMLENYAQEYFLYIAVSSLIIANLSIRSDVEQTNPDYFPNWKGDFFKRDAADMPKYSKNAHIIDYDLFRLGVQMNKENNIAGAFEFGIVVITEIGKERGNNLENQEKKKQADQANQKNDMFNAWMKLLRHAGSVEGVCFVRLICDEQRATSWGADARDTATVINIKEVSEPQVVLKSCWLPKIYLYSVVPAYLKYFYRKVLTYGNARAKPVDHLHTAVSAIYARCERRMNQYSYMTAIVTKQDGTLEDEPQEHEYYISFKKIYSNRYSTDCYKEYFADRALASEYDFVNSDSYESEVAALEELNKQNSYLVADLFAMFAKVDNGEFFGNNVSVQKNYSFEIQSF